MTKDQKKYKYILGAITLLSGIVLLISLFVPIDFYKDYNYYHTSYKSIPLNAFDVFGKYKGYWRGYSLPLVLLLLASITIIILCLINGIFVMFFDKTKRTCTFTFALNCLVFISTTMYLITGILSIYLNRNKITWTEFGPIFSAILLGLYIFYMKKEVNQINSKTDPIKDKYNKLENEVHSETISSDVLEDDETNYCDLTLNSFNYEDDLKNLEILHDKGILSTEELNELKKNYK